jgi:hypothetical protein
MRPAVRIAAGLGVALALVLAPTAGAAASSGDYVARSVTQPASSGLAVTGPLAQFRAVARARVIVPTRWQRQSAPAGQLRFLTPGSSACRYRVTFRATAALGAPCDAAIRLEAQVPAPSAARVLDEGRRGTGAFRVTRPVSADGRITLRALRTTVLTRRADIAPAGQVAWADLSVSAASRPGDECHSGTYREGLGPEIGDALASARTTLRFARP